jgi:hypothetical protein
VFHPIYDYYLASVRKFLTSVKETRTILHQSSSKIIKVKLLNIFYTLKAKWCYLWQDSLSLGLLTVHQPCFSTVWPFCCHHSYQLLPLFTTQPLIFIENSSKLRWSKFYFDTHRKKYLLPGCVTVIASEFKVV